MAITADARLDNLAELRHALALDAAAGEPRVLMAAYARWGERCPEHALGDFAFIIWDGRRGELFCACDRFAVKSLFWHRSERLAAVATEIRGLFALEEIPRRLNEQKLADFLVLEVEDPVSTIYLDVQRLAAAHSLTIGAGGARLRRYWQLDPRRAWEGASDGEYEEAFREAFVRAVRRRVGESQAVASMLSGGLDSSAVSVVAREELRRQDRLPLHTISAIFDAVPGSDEREYISAVLAQPGFEPHFVRPEELGPLDDWDGAAWRGDEPEAHPQVSIARATLRAAADAGVDFLLDGLGGDFVVSFGAERLTELAARGRFISLWREARAFGGADFVSTRRLLSTYAVEPFIPYAVTRLRLARGERKTGDPRWARGMPIKVEFARRAALWKRYELLNRGRERQPRNPRQAQANVTTSALVPLALGIYSRIARGFGVDVRYPFFDSQLVELCLAIPPEQKLRNGYNRDVLRRALSGVLPESIRWRTGKGRPGAYIAHSLPVTGRQVMDEVLLGDLGPLNAYLDAEPIRQQYRACLSGAQSTHWFIVYRVVVAALWLEHAQRRFGLRIGA